MPVPCLQQLPQPGHCCLQLPSPALAAAFGHGRSGFAQPSTEPASVSVTTLPLEAVSQGLVCSIAC